VNYRWQHLSFVAPAGRDDTSIVIVDPATPPGWNLTVRSEPLSGPAAFSAWCAAMKTPAGVVVDVRTERPIAGKAAVVLEQHLRADRQTMRQWQAAICDDLQVAIITMTAREANVAAARAAFDTALNTLTF
jgi:hypothetical protein